MPDLIPIGLTQAYQVLSTSGRVLLATGSTSGSLEYLSHLASTTGGWLEEGFFIWLVVDGFLKYRGTPKSSIFVGFSTMFLMTYEF